jgi:hypothetical protein
MSADIIPFIPRRDRKSVLADFSAPTAAPDDLVMDHVDTSPCEYAWPDEGDPVSTENVNA